MAKIDFSGCVSRYVDALVSGIGVCKAPLAFIPMVVELVAQKGASACGGALTDFDKDGKPQSQFLYVQR